MQVLVVDDDPLTRGLIARLLRLAGHTVVAEARDGAEALELLAHTSPQAIVTDCEMPRLDGIALTRTLRLHDRQTRIIMLSGLNDPGTVQLAKSAGVDEYLCKPLNPTQLISALAA